MSAKVSNGCHYCPVDIIGCGYVGKNIMQRLQALGVTLRCFVHTQLSKNVCQGLGCETHLCSLDTLDLALNQRVVSGFSHHVMAYLAPPQSEGNDDKRIQQFILMLEKLAIPPSKILLISTTGVYGDCAGQWIDECQPANPQVSRSKRRLSAETQLKAYCEKVNIPCIVFRVAGIYAADKLPIKRITSGEPIVKACDSGFTNRIHADDLSAFCVEALIRNVEPGVYNSCDGQPSTMNDYFTRVADALKLPRPSEIGLVEAQKILSKGMLSYLAESKRISNKKLLANFNTRFKYPNLSIGLSID